MRGMLHHLEILCHVWSNNGHGAKMAASQGPHALHRLVKGHNNTSSSRYPQEIEPC